MSLRPLSAIEARVLGTLMEKARTVPDTYPLSLNALVTGCNQKTSRDPLMNLSDDDVLAALEGLKSMSLVFEVSGSRVVRWEHNAARALGVAEPAAALVGLLLLRGPQTPGELRLNGERWYRFADLSSVEAFLQELADRGEDKGGPLVVQLPRAPGAREQRWAHLLCGPVAMPAAAVPAISDNAGGDPGLTLRVATLEAQVAQLHQRLASLCAELGLSQPGQAATNDRA